MKLKFLLQHGYLVMVALISCSDAFDGKDGIKTIKFPGTNEICQTVEYKDGKKNGVLKEYFKNGNLKTIQHFKDDKNVDSALYYHLNGQLAAIQIEKDGYRSGCWKKFNESGGLYSVMCFEKGMLTGNVLTYTYKSLKLIEKYNYKNDSKEGKQETFYNSGKPKSVSYYLNDRVCLGTKEWLENGDTVNNDFAIKYTEQNKVNIENKLYYYVTLENPHSDDDVYRILDSDTGNVITQSQRLEKSGDSFILQFSVYQGGFVMEKVKLAAYRKTNFGNTFIKTISFNASVNNF